MKQSELNLYNELRLRGKETICELQKYSSVGSYFVVHGLVKALDMPEKLSAGQGYPLKKFTKKKLLKILSLGWIPQENFGQITGINCYGHKVEYLFESTDFSHWLAVYKDNNGEWKIDLNSN